MAFNDDLQKMLIYAADDDTINLKLLKTILNQSDFFNVQLFYSGEALLTEVENQIPDLILLDIMMPGLSGYDVLDRLKDNSELHHIPVIMITAAPLEEEMEPLQRSFELGAMDYIAKPFSSIELIMRVKSALRIEKQRKDLERAAEKIRSLEKLLPICSYCKKVRSDNNYWEEVEVYISEHTDTMFSHSICPDCYEVHIKPQLDELRKK
ncbi:MAG: response regulator [Candidatus Cloacimonetes bacterium HGW-Cloacimonetes-1]|jgi:CheY-like chemotaxis protein|nr:MAG: response regulator [Candidatus Cloacimonetes bacterium HGW-Cloacimonetes-1]